MPVRFFAWGAAHRGKMKELRASRVDRYLPALALTEKADVSGLPYVRSYEPIRGVVVVVW